MPNGQDPENQTNQASMVPTSAYSAVSDNTTSYGIESLSKEDFFGADGKPLPLRDIVDLILKHKPDADRKDVEKQVLYFMPKLQAVSEKEKGFISSQYGIMGTEEKRRGLAMTKAKDAYGLSTRAAERGLDASLGQAQQQAGKLGAQMRGAYGGGGAGMRGSIGAHARLAMGVESMYGGYKDKMTGAQQQLGYAKTEADIRGSELSRQYEKGIYGLEQEKAGEFEQDFSQFFSTIEDADIKREGGLVGDKESFSYFLQSIPDAGGN